MAEEPKKVLIVGNKKVEASVPERPGGRSKLLKGNGVDHPPRQCAACLFPMKDKESHLTPGACMEAWRANCAAVANLYRRERTNRLAGEAVLWLLAKLRGGSLTLDGKARASLPENWALTVTPFKDGSLKIDANIDG